MSSALLMEKEEYNNKIYMQLSKTNIDNYICEIEYKKAFFLLILVLERLDNNEKHELIEYYSKKLNDLPHMGYPFEDRRSYQRYVSNVWR